MSQSPKGYRLFNAVAMLFVTMLLISNTIAVKIVEIGGFILPAGILCFPIAYIINDLLVEVYGFERTRGVIWLGFGCLAVMSLLYYLATELPSAAFWDGQPAFEKLFGVVPRIAIASFVAFIVGSFLNASIMSLMKVKMKGKHLWMRTIGSTIIGEGTDSIVFNFVAFYGIFELNNLLYIAFSGFVLKTLYEAVATPATYAAVRVLKRIEGEDKYDIGISYNPFKIKSARQAS